MDKGTDPRQGAPARGVARDAAVADTASGRLRRDSILLQQTPVGYLCVGFGEAARTLRFVFDDGAAARHAFGDIAHLATALDLQDILPAPVTGSAEPLGNAGDRYLSRLAALASLAKSGGYDPNEPRDDLGRWTASAATLLHEIAAFLVPPARDPVTDAKVVADAIARNAPLFAALVARPKRVIASPVTAPLAIILHGLSGYASRSADLPYRAGLSWTSDNGRLEVSQLTENGDTEILFSGLADWDRVYRTADGLVIGRRVGAAGFSVDEAGLATLSARADMAHKDENAETHLNPAVAARIAQAKDQSQDCPLPSPENINGRSPQSLAYQSWITDTPIGFDYPILEVRFDGCRAEDHVTEEAKAFGYKKFMPTPDEFYDGFRGLRAIMRQGAAQSAVNAAIDFKGEWYFAEQWPAAYFRERFKIYPNLTVYYKPHPWEN